SLTLLDHLRGDKINRVDVDEIGLRPIIDRGLQKGLGFRITRHIEQVIDGTEVPDHLIHNLLNLFKPRDIHAVYIHPLLRIHQPFRLLQPLLAPGQEDKVLDVVPFAQLNGNGTADPSAGAGDQTGRHYSPPKMYSLYMISPMV